MVAEALAQDMARLPQLCLREDRVSAYEQTSLPLEEALMNELRHGMEVLEVGIDAGLQRFVDGAGRHGKPDR